MTYSQIYTMLYNIGLPCAFYEFESGTDVAPPFIVFDYPMDDDFKADNSNYVKITQLTVLLYTDEKDFVKEAAVEAALANAGLVFSKSVNHIDSERMYEVTYSMEVIINGEQS